MRRDTFEMADEQATKTSIEQFQCLESCKMCLSVENIVSPVRSTVLLINIVDIDRINALF